MSNPAKALLLSALTLSCIVIAGCGSDRPRLPATDSSTDSATSDSSTNDGGEDSGTPPMDGGEDTGVVEDGGRDTSLPDTGLPPDAGTGGTQLLISEVATQQAAAEFFEIHNPGPDLVDLTNYYVADNSAYHTITSGPWSPAGTPETDFLVRFPPGTTIAAGAHLVIATSDGYEATYAGCPDFYVTSDGGSVTCGGGAVSGMAVPPNGSAGNRFGNMLSNSREMVVLFFWDGSAARVTDVDYLTWGDGFDENTRSDKSGVAGYASDTSAGAQRPAPAPDDLQSIERCDLTEPGETMTGGNGIAGHDETSEDMSASFSIATTPTPGAANGC